MSQTTSGRHTEMEARRDGGSPGLRIDGNIFDAISIRGRASNRGEPRVVRWLETWAGDY